MTLVLVKLWLFVAAGYDLMVRRIPNGLTVGVFLLALGYVCLLHQTPLGASLTSAALGFSVALLFTLPAYIARILGAADVKLFAAISLVGGLEFVVLVFIIAAVTAILGIMAWRCSVVYGLSPARGAGERFIPFGAALALAGSVLVWWPDVLWLGLVV